MKIKLTSLALCLSIFLSCSNDSKEDLENLNFENDSIVLISSFEDFYKAFNMEIDMEYNCIELPKFPKSSGVQEIVRQGEYTNWSQTELTKTMFTSSMAQLLRLSADRLYMCRMKYFSLAVPSDNNNMIFYKESPSCGALPNIDGAHIGTNFTKRGYTMGAVNNTVYLRTHILYVDYDFWSGTVNKHYPCTPQQIKWEYYKYSF